MIHLKDNELIDYVLKHDTDPIRLRLAKVMDNMPGAILDDLEQAGMDPDFCNFEGTYLPGQYIRHLEDEIDYLSNELQEAREKIVELEAMSVMDLISQLRETIYQEQARAALAVKYQHEAEAREEKMKDKLDMWAILNR